MLLVTDERSDHTYFLVAVLRKVETELLCGAKLHEVVIEGLLADFDLRSSLLEGKLDDGAVGILVPSVQETPEAHRRDYLRDGALLDS